MRSVRSLKSTHWVMWSSPLLLLVLVFTLTTSTPSRATSDATSRTVVTTTSVPSPTVSTSTTTPKRSVSTPPHRMKKVPTSTPRSTSVTSDTTRATTTTSGPSDAGSSSSTGSSANSVASAPAENVGSGALSGQLTARFNVAVVPLEGPGTWTVAASAATDVTLSCQGSTIDVQTQLEIGAHQECQVTITPASTITTLTWQLLPAS